MTNGDVERFQHEQEKNCELLTNEYIVNNVTDQCPPSFDGLLCWPSTVANATAVLSCPPQAVLGYENPNNGTSTKQCLPGGNWYSNSLGVTWSNYTLCTPPPGYFVTAVENIEITHSEFAKTHNSTVLIKWVPIIKTIAKVGYASSMTTLIIALIIFLLLRKLRNHRNRLHMHLFVSFIMRAFMALLKDRLIVNGIGSTWNIILVDGKSTFITEKHIWVCKVITSAWQYFIVANYAWIFMEGLYLHNLVFLAFCADTSAITVYIILGWGLPAIVVGAWVVIRVLMEDTLCWTTNNNPYFFLIIRIPIMVSILLNFILFLNIVRVLLIKMKTSVHLQRKKMHYGRWAKSTLVLVPLFGAHYTIFLGLSYHHDHQVELIWLFCDQLFASFQGCFVALLYCLMNGEVRAEMRRAWRAQRSRRGADSLILTHRNFGKPGERSQRSIRANNANNTTRAPDYQQTLHV
ncbi:parathyroid hormone 2 receptor [Diachasma alloeum]|uniref:parathyroid hormone 2 receptor n=1 Tax=Diachasma alloeum TaxID=454923 RepID=UPI0007381226|nr:parathyroid hormone 2 receptor [Diachasma alloeum]XP_015118509.1 parathyroid hormone 2 receptor [Diachasma alloeum]